MSQAAAMLVLAGTETRADLGRVMNALQIARKLHEAGDEVTVILDGAGTQWVPTLSDPEHKYHRLFDGVRERVAGACSYCAGAYGSRTKSRAPKCLCSTSSMGTRVCAS
jgi:hypothetical protein